MARFGGSNPSQSEHYQATARLLYAASAKVNAAHEAELRGDKGTQWMSTVDAYGLLEQALSQAKDGDVPRGEIAEARGARDKLRAQIIDALGGFPHQRSQVTMLNPIVQNPSVWPWLLGLGLVAGAGALLWWHGKRTLQARMNQGATTTTGQHITPRVVDLTSPQDAVTLVGNKNESLVALMYCSSSAAGNAARQFLDIVSAQPENEGITFYAVDVNAVMSAQVASGCKSADVTLAVQRATLQGAQVKLESVNAATDPGLVAWVAKGPPAEEAILHAVRWVKGIDGPAPSQTFMRAA